MRRVPAGILGLMVVGLVSCSATEQAKREAVTICQEAESIRRAAEEESTAILAKAKEDALSAKEATEAKA